MLSPVKRLHHLLEEIELADRVGLDVFGIGEHHRAEFLDSAPVVVLSAADTPGSYFNVGGMLLIRLKRPSRPGAT
jgi:alkanesulfonate monooxygenase SsuD/methylene tetrahydromethanopterin reductase-like flavin-dependent oxidoreductase (luciferase family)